MKTAELTGPALDWAVAAAKLSRSFFSDSDIEAWALINKPSTNWCTGGPIIEGVGISNTYWGKRSRFGQSGKEDRFWEARHPSHRTQSRRTAGYGPTPLIAAMRCYVASKFGCEIDIPEGLI